MKHKNLLVISLVTVMTALLVSACQPMILSEMTVASVEPVPLPQTSREDAPTYGMRGPYAVGIRDFVIEPTQEGEWPIPVSVWYPALNPDGRAELETYRLNFENPIFPNFDVAGRALRDAQPDSTGGPYPLVVYSHGYWQYRQASVYLMEQLASWGFVVIAGDHTDNWSVLFQDINHEDYVIRLQEVGRKIDFADTLNDTDGAFPGLIDVEQVGVTGHSFGADTALLIGGGRLNTNVFLDEWCIMHPGDPQDPLNECVAMQSALDKMTALASLDAVPEGVWPDWRDPRVDVVVPMASGPQFFGTEGIATVQVPIMLIEGDLDFAQAAAAAYYKPYTVLPADLKTHVVFEGGDHGLYLNECKATPALPQMGFGFFCLDPVWDMNRAHDLINHFVTAFMLAELKGDADAASALAPENAAFPGVTYETTAYPASVEATKARGDDMIKTVSEFEAIDVACADGNVVLTDNPFLAGTSEIVEVNQEPGELYFTSLVVLYPDAFPDATWVAPGEGVDTLDGGFIVIHRAYGTGTLEGSEILFTATSAPGLTDLPCEPAGPVVILDGVIIHPVAVAESTSDSPMTATDFEAIDAACADGNVVLSADPRIAGRSEIEAFQEPDDAYFRVNATFLPDAYPDSSWVSPGEGLDAPDGSFIVLHGGYGTGAFEGSQMMFTVVPTEVPDLPCEPVGPVVKLKGVIIAP